MKLLLQHRIWTVTVVMSGALVGFILFLKHASSQLPCTTPVDCEPPPPFIQIAATGTGSYMGVFALDAEGAVWNKMSDGCWSRL